MKLSNKKILVLGLANKRSIAWGIIQKLRAEGAQVGICYFHESNLKRVKPLAEEAGADFLVECDVTSKEDLMKLHATVKENWGSFDGLAHSIAFSPSEEFEKPFVQCSKEGFFNTLDISAYSLISVTNALLELKNPQFSILALSYYGAQKVLPGYNLMGVAKAALESIVRYLAVDLGGENIRVNCISAGPIKTSAATGIPNFSHFLDEIEKHSPLKQNVDIHDVGNLASFLMSDDSSRISGQTLFVDSGMSVIAR